MSLFGLANPYPDRREEFQAGYSYRCIIFALCDGEAYRLVAERTTASGVEEVVVAELASRTAACVDDPAGALCAAASRQRVSADGTFVPYGGEWGLYDRLCQRDGIHAVWMLRCAAWPRNCRPAGRSISIRSTWAVPRRGLTLVLAAATVRPVFLPHPTLGDQVTFADVAAHDVSRMAVVQAVREMFGLCFYTDEVSRTVLCRAPPLTSTATTWWWTGVDRLGRFAAGSRDRPALADARCAGVGSIRRETARRPTSTGARVDTWAAGACRSAIPGSRERKNAASIRSSRRRSG